MKFLELFRRESNIAFLRPLIIFAIVAGACNTAVLVIMNTASSQLSERSDPKAVESVDMKLFLFYLLAIFGFILTKKHTIFTASRMVEEIIGKIRIRIVNKVRFSEYAVVENLDQGTLYNRIIQQTQTISQNAPMTMDMLQSSMMLVFSMFYVIYLSIPAFVIVAICTAIAIYLYEKRRQALVEMVQKANKKELEIYESLDMVLKGFKEIKLNQKKNNAVFGDYRQKASVLRNLRISITLLFAENVIFAQIFFYMLIGIVLFGLPMFVGSFSEDISKITAAVLFFMGPLSTLVGSIPAIINTNEAIDGIYSLEASLDENLGEDVKAFIEDFDTSEEVEYEPFKFENEIVISNILFTYQNKKGDAFTLGPIDQFRLKKGELIFIEGGNGSGKSTLLKIVTGLYYPNPGAYITVDGRVVDKKEYQNYRELFAAIFTDFHLARKLYGLRDIDKDKADQLLKLMKIDDKTKIIADSFTDIDLSTGQRKRLALLVTYLEDKEIYAFDEVAADQDPQFREYFYKQMLPELQSRGKTVIVISHDDRYFSCAERKLKMEYGKVIHETKYSNGEIVHA